MSASSSSLPTIPPKTLKSFEEYNQFLTETKKNLKGICEAKLDDDFTHEARLLNIEYLQTECALKAKEIFTALAEANENLRKQLIRFEELARQLTQLATDTFRILKQFHFGQLNKLQPIEGQDPGFVQFNPDNLAVPKLTQAHYLRRFLLLELTVDATIPCVNTKRELEEATLELQTVNLAASNLLTDAKTDNLTDAYKAGVACAEALSKKIPAKIGLLKFSLNNRNNPKEDLPSEQMKTERVAKLQ